MFDLNLIEGVYNKFGNEIERIYNNRNEIILDLDDGSNDYLWVEPDESMIGTGSNYIGFVKVNPPYNETNMPQNSIQYSFDGINWEYMPYDEKNASNNEIEITQKTYFRYVHDGFIRHRIYGRHATSSSGWDKFKCNVGGSLHKYINNVYYNEILFGLYKDESVTSGVKPFFVGISIIDASKLHVDYYKNDNVLSYGYHSMFYKQSFMTTPPILHIGKVEENGCFIMFSGCKSLTTAPELPSTDLSKHCYYGMFYGCTSLVNAPELPATILAYGCYNGMFEGCTSLVNAPELPATILADSCYNSMFLGCTSLVNADKLPATTLAENCYNSMFRGCTSLVNAPKLPATILADSCYNSMFLGCTSLVNAPELPANILYDYCYYDMFGDCTSLVNAPALPATTLSNYCYQNMFFGCTSLIRSPKLMASQLFKDCYNSMFEGCSSLSNITCYAENTTTGLNNWVKGVNNTGVFNKRKGVEWPSGISGIPENWTVNEI